MAVHVFAQHMSCRVFRRISFFGWQSEPLTNMFGEEIDLVQVRVVLWIMRPAAGFLS